MSSREDRERERERVRRRERERERESDRAERDRERRKSGGVQQPTAAVKPSASRKERTRDVEDGSRYVRVDGGESGGSGGDHTRRHSRRHSQHGTGALHVRESSDGRPRRTEGPTIRHVRDSSDEVRPARRESRHVREKSDGPRPVKRESQRERARPSEPAAAVGASKRDSRGQSASTGETSNSTPTRGASQKIPIWADEMESKGEGQRHSRRESQRGHHTSGEHSRREHNRASYARGSDYLPVATAPPTRGPERHRSHMEGSRAAASAQAAQEARVQRSKSHQPRSSQRQFKEPPLDHSPLLEKPPRASGRTDGAADLEKGVEDLEVSSSLKRSRRRPARSEPAKRRCHPCFWILLVITILLLIILVPVGVLVLGKDSGSASGSEDSESKSGRGGNLAEIDRASIPQEAKGTYLDPFSWADTKDFNLTYTDERIADLPIMGLFSDFDDSTQANDNVPPLNEPFPYGKQPIHGVNVGGWLVMEPFITPSYFREWDDRFGVIDEYTLSKQLGPEMAKKTFEEHYAKFITRDSFKEIRDAGLDHVRIPFGYWVALTLEGDPYVPMVSWRYLLRAIEYCREYGLRVKLDLHGAPGGANGWNHSGRLGPINWLNGTDGQRNGDLTLELHDKLSQFFSQPRYKNVVTIYGLVNEPRMTYLDADKVIAWSEEAYKIITGNGFKGLIVFGDGFRGLDKWKGEFQGMDQMVLDVHQYVIFNTGQLSQTHTQKIQFACSGWSAQLKESLDKETGFGPTMVGEWGQADTDCTPYLNNVGIGARWEGKLLTDDPSTEHTEPSCPNGVQCSCEKANEHPSKYLDSYREFLLKFAIAQMDSFEYGYGWMYWTWDTEDAHQWSYKKGLDAGILPKVAYDREWSCSDEIPDFADMGLPEYY